MVCAYVFQIPVEKMERFTLENGITKLDVCCVYWGDKFSTDYVQKLYYMVQRHLTIPHRFIVFTDHVKLHKLIHNKNGNITYESFPEHALQGWWNKLYMFHPYFKTMIGNKFYLDLDTVILDDLDKFIKFGMMRDFCITRDFGQPTTIYNSSVMRWHSNINPIIWDGYLKNKQKYDRMQGDQNVITDIMNGTSEKIEKKRIELNPFPDEWTFSYKWRNRMHPVFARKDWTFERVPGTSIAVFHGNPKPHESTQEWVKENWK